MVEVAGTGDEATENNTVQESRSVLATVIAALEEIGIYLLRWYYRILRRLLMWMEERPEYAVMLIVNLIIWFR